MQEEPTQTIPQLLDDVRAGKLSRRRLMHGLAARSLSAAAVSSVAGNASRTPAAPQASAPVVHPDQERAQNLKLHEQNPSHQQRGH